MGPNRPAGQLTERSFPERLDAYLVNAGLAESRRIARELVGAGAVLINGRVCWKKATLVRADDRIDVYKPDPLPPLTPEPEPELDVLFSDEAAIVVNKPGLLACHPLNPGERGTLMNRVAAAFPETAEVGDQRREGGLIHRLDNGTSGAVLIARNNEAFFSLRRELRGGAIKRQYRALVVGKLTLPLELAAPIGHLRGNARKMAAQTDSKRMRGAPRPAFSIVQPIRYVDDATLVSVTPSTGARHQIRVHLASAGFPIVGDELYGAPSTAGLAKGRHWLHLEQLVFQSPTSGKVTVTAPLPVELAAMLNL